MLSQVFSHNNLMAGGGGIDETKVIIEETQ